MNWYEYDKELWQSVNDIAILEDATEINLNDDNAKPDWVEFPAKYTEFHIKRNSKKLVLVIGESWTYGETLPEIATGIKKYSMHSQLRYSFGPKLAVMLNADYYQYAVPGNCNYYMFNELERILNFLRNFNYEKIYVCMQLTEPSREKAILIKIKDHPIEQLYWESISFEEWLKKYNRFFFDWYNSILNKNKDLNIDAILWKNFCKTETDSNHQFKILDKTWIEYSANILGKQISSPVFYSIGWLSNMYEEHKNINYNKQFILEEMEKIEKSNEFIKANVFHSHHPNFLAHLLWSQFIARKSGWVDGI
jgi:hypothetical protein